MIKDKPAPTSTVYIQQQRKKASIAKSLEETEKLARWMSLYEAVNLIYNKSEEKGVDFNDVKLNPLDILSYINSTSNNIQRKLLEVEHGIHTIYTDN